MKRVEIMLSQAIESDFEDNFLKECKKIGQKCKYTKITNVMGQGNCNPKLGDPIWPQLNSMFIIYAEDDQVQKIQKVVENINSQYIGEGAAAFVTEAQVLV